MTWWLVAAYVLGFPPSWVACVRFMLDDLTLGDDVSKLDTSDRLFAIGMGTVVALFWPAIVLPVWVWRATNASDHLANLVRLIAPPEEPPTDD